MKSACLVALLAGALCSPAADQPASHVRIVRLSFVEGDVTLQRSGSTEWSRTPVNTPIQEGFKLRTGSGSFAEVEFEDGSTARLGELSSVEFAQLALAASGARLSRLALDSGYGSFHVVAPEGNQFEVDAGDARLTPRGGAQFRADLAPDRLRVEVFKGSVDVSSPEGTASLGKGNVLNVSSGTDEAFNLSTGIRQDDWDRWVEQRDKVEASDHIPKAYRGLNSPAYGWSDLYNYGSWSDCGGLGWGWSPFVTAGWSPYTFGQWVYYPSFGYTWIGYEPWGWLPYHYGAWSFDAGCGGWAWFPGGFTSWSPALVSWYSGPGWIGWAPPGIAQAAGGAARTRPARPRTPFTIGCAAGGTCIAAESIKAFANGKPVRPTTVLSEDLTQATPVAQPEVAPEASAFLPGRQSKPAFSLDGATRTPAAEFSAPGAGAAAAQIAGRPAPSATMAGGGFGSARYATRRSVENGGFWGGRGFGGAAGSSGVSRSGGSAVPRASSSGRESGGGGSVHTGGGGGSAHASPTPH